MAEIVGAFGVPPTPVFPWFVNRDRPDCEIARRFGAVADEFREQTQARFEVPGLDVEDDTQCIRTGAPQNP